MKNFWQDLKKPIVVLAPMSDVTDAAFRRIIAKYGKHNSRALIGLARTHARTHTTETATETGT